MVWRNLVIALILALPLAGIANAQEKKLEPLIVSYSSFTGNRAPLWIAKELGLYEKHGLDVKLVSIAAGSVSLTDFLLRRILAKLGFIIGKDVSLIPTGVSESEKRIQLMFQGKIDATIGESDKVFQFAELGGQKISVLGEPKDFGVPSPGSEINTTRQFLKELRPRLKAFFMAYSEAIAAGRKNKELTYQVFRKYMRVENPKLLDFTYRVKLLDAIHAKPYPREDAIQASIEDLKESTPKLEGMKATDFFDASLIKEIDNDGFFTRLGKP